MLSENKTSPQQPDFLPGAKGELTLTSYPQKSQQIGLAPRNGSLHLEHQKFRLNVSIGRYGHIQTVQRVDQDEILSHGSSRDLSNHIVMIGVPLVKNVNEPLRGCDVNAFTSRVVNDVVGAP